MGVSVSLTITNIFKYLLYKSSLWFVIWFLHSYCIFNLVFDLTPFSIKKKYRWKYPVKILNRLDCAFKHIVEHAVP